MVYTRVKNREISIIVEKSARGDKIVVWGCFYGKGGKDFQRYFETMEKAMTYYNKQIEKALEMYLEKCKMIINK